MSLFIGLLVLALVLTLLSVPGRVPLWPAVFVLIVALLVKFLGAVV